MPCKLPSNSDRCVARQLAGSVLSFLREDQREVGYWLGRAYWGRGIATRALTAFLGELPTRPLFARAAKDNRASLRVLEKCGCVVLLEARAFAKQVGFPLILKPRAGAGASGTYRVDDAGELEAAIRATGLDRGVSVAVEEFIEGHEGFFDTITDGEGVRHEFAAHYFPSCLQANQDRTIAPQIAVTNRIGEDGYDELRSLGHRVVDALDIRHCGTHMEWFFGPKGMKFSEIGARPAGEKIWDMYRFANEFDVYRERVTALVAFLLALDDAPGDLPIPRGASGPSQAAAAIGK